MRNIFTKPVPIFIAVFLLFGAFSAPAQTKKPAPHHNRRQDQKIIQKMEDTWRAALLAGNPKPLEPMLADDFLGIGANGTISNKTQYLENIRAGRFTLHSMDVDSTNIRMLPDVAIVTSAVRVDAQLNGAPYRGLFRYTRVYRLIGNEWKVINFEATRVSGSSRNDLQLGQPLPKPRSRK